MNQTCYLFTREQLLKALEAHATSFTDPQQADRMRIFVLAFIDGDAARINGLHFTPSPVGVEAQR